MLALQFQIFALFNIDVLKVRAPQFLIKVFALVQQLLFHLTVVSV